MPRKKNPETAPTPAPSKWTLRSIDASLVAAGWPEVSDEWWIVLDKVYASKQRNIVGRWGRRAGKSSTLAGRVAVFEVISGRHVVPPGDTGWFAILSADKDQAKERLETCSKALKVLGIAHRKTATEITLDETNLGIKAFAATTSAVVSFTCIGFLCDEMAHWRDKDSGANPAKEIVKLLRPTMATMPNAKGWYVSAPFSTLDYHHKMFTKGENRSQLVFFGTTPEMNPTLTDEMIVELEDDEQTRQTAYYCVPMSSDETKFFPAAFIDMAKSMPLPMNGSASRTAGGADFAFTKNSTALAVVDKFENAITRKRRDMETSEPGFRLTLDEERKPGALPLVPSVTISEMCGLAAMMGADSIACDQHYLESVREETDELEMPLMRFPSDQKEISNAYTRFRVLLAERRIDLSLASDRLIEQLKQTSQKPTKNGAISIVNKKAADGSHGDLVSALICAFWAHEQENLEHNSTMSPRRFHTRGEVQNSEEIDDLPPERFLN